MNALVLMAKWPEAGQVKTRLIGALSAQEAAELYAAILADIVAQSHGKPLWQTIVSFHPPSAEERFRAQFPKLTEFWPQEGPDLAARMSAVFRQGFCVHQKVVMRNTDSPEIPAARLEEAFSALEDYDLVLGPDRGGGYYLIGMNAWQEELFDIPLSSGRSFEDTRAAARDLGLRIKILPEEWDLDTPADLEVLSGRWAAEDFIAICPRTATRLQSLDIKADGKGFNP